MKKFFCFLLVALTLASTLSGCSKAENLPENAAVVGIFKADGSTYFIRNGRYVLLDKNTADGSQFTKLTWQNDRATATAAYSDKTGRVYFTRAHKLFSSDLNGLNVELMWAQPGGAWKDYASILAVCDDYLFVEIANRKSDYSYVSREVHAIDVSTGEDTVLMSGLGYNRVPMPICVFGNTVYAIQVTDAKSKAHIISIDLASGAVTELNKFDGISTSSIGKSSGAVVGDRIYFITEGAGIYTMSVAGGDLREIQPDDSAVSEFTSIPCIKGHNGKVYMLRNVWDDSASALCEWDIATNKVIPLVTTDASFKIRDILFDGDTYYLISGSKVQSGSLSDLY